MSLILRSSLFDDCWDNHAMHLFHPYPFRQMTPFSMCPSHSTASQSAIATNSNRVVDNEEKFAVNLDVRHFKPDELKVTMADNMVTIEGDHEEKSDEHGMISRHFVRKYQLPHDVDAQNLKSSLSKDGVLTIEAPKLALEGNTSRSIPITFGNA